MKTEYEINTFLTANRRESSQNPVKRQEPALKPGILHHFHPA